jgi:nicotinamidase-related amidase
MDPNKTALILIGYQNDYFASDGILREVIEETLTINNVLKNTTSLLNRLVDTPVLIISTPIQFTPDYRELVKPVGILKVIKEVGAFKMGSKGSETIPELDQFGERIKKVPGKRGLNAFSNTQLDDILQRRNIINIVLAGVVTSICIDSTGRSASERGYKVIILSDCTSGRTEFEQKYYCDEIFPLYAEVINHIQLLNRIKN